MRIFAIDKLSYTDYNITIVISQGTLTRLYCNTPTHKNQYERINFMNELQIFNYNDKQVRTVEQDGETWWVLKDVCDVLELSKTTRVAERLDDDEVNQTHLTDSLGRNQKTYIINESGLYSVILRSDKPEAKPFRKWVTSEVLPSIRKNGGYAPDIEKLVAATVVKAVAEALSGLSSTSQHTSAQAKPIAQKCTGANFNQTTWSRLDDITQSTVLGMMQNGKYSSQQISQFILDKTGIYISQVTVSRYKRTFFTVV